MKIYVQSERQPIYFIVNCKNQFLFFFNKENIEIKQEHNKY